MKETPSHSKNDCHWCFFYLKFIYSEKATIYEIYPRLYRISQGRKNRVFLQVYFVFCLLNQNSNIFFTISTVCSFEEVTFVTLDSEKNECFSTCN